MLEASWKQEPKIHIQPWILTSWIACMCTRNGEVAEPLSSSLFGKQAYNQKDAIRKKRRQGTINSNPRRSAVMQFVNAYVINPPRSRLKWITNFLKTVQRQSCAKLLSALVKFCTNIIVQRQHFQYPRSFGMLFFIGNGWTQYFPDRTHSVRFVKVSRFIKDKKVPSSSSKPFEKDYKSFQSTNIWQSCAKKCSVRPFKFLARISYRQLWTHDFLPIEVSRVYKRIKALTTSKPHSKWSGPLWVTTKFHSSTLQMQRFFMLTHFALQITSHCKKDTAYLRRTVSKQHKDRCLQWIIWYALIAQCNATVFCMVLHVYSVFWGQRHEKSVLKGVQMAQSHQNWQSLFLSFSRIYSSRT